MADLVWLGEKKTRIHVKQHLEKLERFFSGEIVELISLIALRIAKKDARVDSSYTLISS